VATLDLQSNAVVIRVVYDGSPLAGKTTSIRSLGEGLGARVSTPAEVNGRTVYFDWLDYTGGLFEGHRIRCQIISVPGQASLAARRRRLLESADAVVFVGDSTPEGFDSDCAYLAGLYSVLRELPGPPVGIVLQANKRDFPDAIPLEKLRCMLDELGMKMGIVESVATEGSGIREAFVFAVRLALDRVRELMRSGDLARGKPLIDTPQELLQDLKQREDSALDLSVAEGLRHIRLSQVRGGGSAQEALEEVLRGHAESHSAPTGGDPVATPEPQGEPPDAACPKAPDERVASGMVWPPIDGRAILQEIGASAVRLQCSVDGEWSGIVNQRWRILSSGVSRFATAEQGRSALIDLARTYSVNMRADSPERCAALAPDGHGAFRLWQITRLEQSAAS
jgi:signal recognition particle receptor subunit beta